MVAVALWKCKTHMQQVFLMNARAQCLLMLLNQCNIRSVRRFYFRLFKIYQIDAVYYLFYGNAIIGNTNISLICCIQLQHSYLTPKRIPLNIIERMKIRSRTWWEKRRKLSRKVTEGGPKSDLRAKIHCVTAVLVTTFLSLESDVLHQLLPYVDL